MSDDALPPVSAAPRGPRSAGLAVVLPTSQAAAVVDLTARRARAAVVVDLTATERANTTDEAGLSIQDRVRLRALEAAGHQQGHQQGRQRQLVQVAPCPGRTPSTR